ncbi:MAG: N-6 DNA methylase [Actinomycetaceae bacterium]|nr:N-6 DNA methylase [Actinomycetaceae bacterium]MDY6083287.1 N-6 DNA methylase [Actinomycetaceae bacterium]
MIGQANLRETLRALGFEDDGDILVGKFGSGLTNQIMVDFRGQHIRYPDALRINENQTTNFSHPENFVVLECVYRLLKKGYRPEHLELEKRWSLGHLAKGGRADICVYDETGDHVVSIIECKTAGTEYKKAHRQLMNDGGQLFSYRQQEGSARWLSLYTSDFKDGQVSYETEVIAAYDDPQKVKQAEKDGTITLYRDATSVPTLFAVWKETYGQQLQGDLIFGTDSSAYDVKVLPLRKRDLKEFTPDDNIVNRFEEILRHNNVSDKENAFNRLIALFICKLVDEYEKTEDDVVDFQYRQGSDTYESLQDRLQRLHQEGMQKFMKEKIFYIPADYPQRLFENYTSSKRRKAIEDLDRTIRILKFYSNNDFAFKDVHNEELFFQNGKVLVEVVQLFERYRIVYTKKHQFLGDLFEQLLNKGFKQNEGQFFTPMPITRFMWDSLPMERIAGSEAEAKYPRVVDYACGAGHFLTEAVEAINAFHRSYSDNSWVRDHIFGIEKDYRLARVSKISLFMNGAGEGTIIFGDGLENNPEQGITPHSFEVLVANPPYSVKAFKQHLDLKDNDFELIERIGDQGGEIEVLFVERIAQLLKPKGIAAVILPSSILSNDSASYTGARELLLKNFFIRAIVQFGSKTFGATGTNTVVLFLEKYDEPPKHSALIEDSVNAILTASDLKDWDDKEIFEEYCAHIQVEKDLYRRSVIEKAVPLDDLAKIEHFKPYLNSFNGDLLNKLQKTKTFKALPESQQTAKVQAAFYDYIRPIEAEKILFFALTRNQSTLVITAPSDNKKQKEFLGYDWSNRKGSEGIKILQPGGKLYDDADRYAEGTLAAAVRESFDHAPILTEENSAYASVLQTADMLDFSRAAFSAAIALFGSAQVDIHSAFPVDTLGNLVDINLFQDNPARFPNKYFTYVDIDAVGKGTGEISFAKRILGSEAPSRARRLAHKDNIVISTVRPNLRAFAILKEEPDESTLFSTGFAILQVKNEDVLLPKYLYVLFQNTSALMDQMTSKMGKGQYPSINESDIKSLRIPVPPISVQCKILDACSAIDAEYESTRMSIETYREKIQQLFADLDVLTAGGGSA